MTQRKIKTRERIIQSAREEFQLNGYAGARMQKIADNAGINKGLLHYYFKSKDKIFEEVLEETFIVIFTAMNTTLSKDLDLFVKIELFISEYINIISKNSFAPNFLIQEINRNPDFIREKLSFINQFDGLIKFSKQVKENSNNNRIIKIDPSDLIINMISLSVFPFVAAPMVKKIMKYKDNEFKQMIEKRKTTVSQFIINAIKQN